jgi:hypothetical protein
MAALIRNLYNIIYYNNFIKAINKLKTLNLEYTTIKILFVLTGLIGFSIIFLITNKWGIGVSTDSVGYLAGAVNIVNGRGISVLYDSSGNPLTLWLPWGDNEVFHVFPWPPFLPIVLSIFGSMKLNLIVAGRFLNAAIFGANVFLVTYIVKKYTKSIFLMVLAPIILISSKDMLLTHSNLWSEPLFILMGLLGFLFLIKFLEKKKLYFLLTASLFFSLAFFTRTVGISLIAVSVIAVLLYSELRLKKKLFYSILSAFIGILPFSIWTIRNYLNYGSSVEFIYHPFKLTYYTRILRNISLWVMPDKVPEKVRIILLTFLIAVIISIASYIAFKNRKRRTDDHYKLNSKITGIFLFHILFYFIALMFARYFFDNSIVPELSRFLLPILISIFIIFLFFLKRFLDFFSKKENIKSIIYIFCGFLLVASFYNSNAISLYNVGQWYSNSSWIQSETISELEKIQKPQDLIYTNEPAAIYLFTGRSSEMLPAKYNMRTDRVNSDYQNDLDTILKEIKEKNGILVFFDKGWGSIPKEGETELDSDFYLFKDTSDGAIYRVKS